MGIPPEQVNIVEVSNDEILPDYCEISGIVVTGSHDMVTDHLGWSEYTAKWLPGAVDRRIPTLGICHGHQLLAHSLGGRVATNPPGSEIGTVAVRLDELAQDDLLLGGMGGQIRVHVFHRQPVLDLPPGARGLAESDLDRFQAFVVGDRLWGVQFHPEFDADIVVHYINHYPEILLREGADPDACMKQVADSADGSLILKKVL